MINVQIIHRILIIIQTVFLQTVIMKNETEFEEEHTALSDSIIETEILLRAVENGAELEQTYPTKQSLAREVERELNIVRNKEVIASFNYKKITISKDRTKITLK